MDDKSKDLFGEEEDSNPKGITVQAPEHWSLQWMKFIIKRKAILEVLTVMAVATNTWFLIALNQKIELQTYLTKKTTRLAMEDAFLNDNGDYKNLLDVATKYKIKLEDKYLYATEEGETLGEILEKIEKFKARPAAQDVPAIPRKSRSKTLKAKAKKETPPKEKTISQKAQECTDDDCLRAIIDEINENTENAEFYYNQRRRR